MKNALQLASIEAALRWMFADATLSTPEFDKSYYP